MKLEILVLARNDLIEGYRFYEKQQSGLGDYFLVNLYADVESLKIFAGIHKKVYKGFYRALSRRFPFAIYYTVEEKTVKIRSILDCRKDLSEIKEHLKKA
ncbi:MAG TPA: hypothetical protein VKM36_00635 [Balneolaceae bacterium]|nr:hypothetical protein [Balneolaceae bacterium]